MAYGGVLKVHLNGTSRLKFQAELEREIIEWVKAKMKATEGCTKLPLPFILTLGVSLQLIEEQMCIVFPLFFETANLTAGKCYLFGATTTMQRFLI